MILGDVCTRRCGFCNVQTGRADLQRPARAAAGRNPGQAHGPAPRRRHLGRSRRPAGLRGRRLRRRDPLDPHAGAGLQGRGPDPRLPRPGDAAGEGGRRAARRLQPQRRDRAAALPDRPPRLGLRALVPGAADGEGDRRRAGADQVGADGRARRELRRDGRGVRGTARAAGSRSSPSASTCDRPRPAPAGGPLLAARGVRRPCARPRYELGFESVAAGPLVRSSYHADEAAARAVAAGAG